MLFATIYLIIDKLFVTSYEIPQEKENKHSDICSLPTYVNKIKNVLFAK